MIHAEGLCKYYSGYAAIENVNFSIREGEIVGLLGLNGAGKSTILKIFASYLLPSKGHATVGGFSVEDQPDDVRKLIGYLPDVPPLYAEMTVRSYLEYVARLKSVKATNVRPFVDDAMHKTNLHEVSAVTLSELSHGFKQRIGIAQAIVHKPKVLILDEPINGLDPVQIVEMRDLVVSLRTSHTVILSSHILSEITKTCDRILVVDRGTVVAEGSEAELERQYTTSVRVRCEIKADLKHAQRVVNAVSGIEAVEVLPEVAPGVVTLQVSMSKDVRSELARAVVSEGLDLMAMTKVEVGLESVFLKLVQNN